MTGNEAAKIIGDLCISKKHQRAAGPPNTYVVCADCSDYQNALRAKDRATRPTLHLAAVHFVIDPATGRIGAKMDEDDAIAAAKDIKGRSGVLASERRLPEGSVSANHL